MSASVVGGPGTGNGRREPAAAVVPVLVLLTLGTALATGWLLMRSVGRTFERQEAVVLAARLDGIERAVGRHGRELAHTVEQLAASGAGELGRLSAGGPGAFDEARRLADAAGLDLLSALAPDATVVSSKHWPQLAGLKDEALARVPGGPAVLRPVRGAQGSALALLVRRPLPGRGGLQLIGGRWIDRGFAEDVAAGRPTMWLDPVQAPLWGTGSVRPGSESWNALASELPLGGWTRAARTLVDDEGRVQAEIRVGRPRDAIDALLERMQLLFLGVGGAAVLLAIVIGGWLTARINRPMRQLVGAIDAIAAGQADYDFPRAERDEPGQVAGAFSRLRRSLELQRLRSAAAERVAAWREVARHVAHEVKNPLAPIRLTVENLERARRKDPALFERMFDEGARTILEEVEQLRRLVGEFSEFARLPQPRPELTELHELIDGALALFSAEPDVEFVRRYAARPCIVRVDTEQLGRALKNVVANAVEASRDGPAANSARVEVVTALEGDMVALDVCDNGPGIPQESRLRVFEPYFTTKQQGTGLGMAIVYRIVTEHGGVIAAEDRAEGGARIRIRLPREVPS